MFGYIHSAMRRLRTDVRNIQAIPRSGVVQVLGVVRVIHNTYIVPRSARQHAWLGRDPIRTFWPAAYNAPCDAIMERINLQSAELRGFATWGTTGQCQIPEMNTPQP